MGDLKDYHVGQRVEFIRDWGLAFPHFYVDKGMTGVIVFVDENCSMADDIAFSIKADEAIDGAEEWDNEIHVNHEYIKFIEDYIKIIN